MRGNNFVWFQRDSVVFKGRSRFSAPLIEGLLVNRKKFALIFPFHSCCHGLRMPRVFFFPLFRYSTWRQQLPNSHLFGLTDYLLCILGQAPTPYFHHLQFCCSFMCFTNPVLCPSILLMSLSL